jgi:hypothetical protein
MQSKSKTKTEEGLFIARMRKRAGEKNLPPDFTQTGHGWKEEDSVYRPVWYEGEQMPSNLSDSIEEEATHSTVGLEDQSNSCIAMMMTQSLMMIQTMTIKGAVI